jgi:N-acetylglucosamine-6-phosphate deacetylase
VDRIKGRILTPDGWLEGELRFERTILEVVPRPVPAGAPRILPGFIDVHVHGGGGFDAMDGAEGVRGLARFHACHGTTALLATTITNPCRGCSRPSRISGRWSGRRPGAGPECSGPTSRGLSSRRAGSGPSPPTPWSQPRIGWQPCLG